MREDRLKMGIHCILQLLIFMAVGDGIFISRTARLVTESFYITILMQLLHIPLDIALCYSKSFADLLRFKTTQLVTADMRFQGF